MNLRTIFAAIALAVALVLVGPGTSAAQDLYFGGFDGVWEGKLRNIDPAASGVPADPTWAPKDSEFRLSIAGDTARLFIKEDGTWQEIRYIGDLHVIAHKTTAIVYAVHSSPDVMDTTGSGGWVESSTFTLTHKDRKSLFVYWVRSVNNYLEPFDHKDDKGAVEGRFLQSAFGELTLSNAQ